MKVKVKLHRDYSDCPSLKKIVEIHGLEVEGLFQYDRKLKVISGTDTNTRRMISQCSDVIEVIIDRDNSRPV